MQRHEVQGTASDGNYVILMRKEVDLARSDCVLCDFALSGQTVGLQISLNGFWSSGGIFFVFF